MCVYIVFVIIIIIISKSYLFRPVIISFTFSLVHTCFTDVTIYVLTNCK